MLRAEIFRTEILALSITAEEQRIGAFARIRCKIDSKATQTRFNHRSTPRFECGRAEDQQVESLPQTESSQIESLRIGSLWIATPRIGDVPVILSCGVAWQRSGRYLLNSWKEILLPRFLILALLAAPLGR